jgi:hypothetical protein
MSLTLGTIAAASKSQLVAFATTATLTAGSLGIVTHRHMVDMTARVDAAAVSQGRRHGVQAGTPAGQDKSAANQAADLVGSVGGPHGEDATHDFPSESASLDTDAAAQRAAPPVVGLNATRPEVPVTVTLPLPPAVEDTVHAVEDTLDAVGDAVGDTVDAVEDTVDAVGDTAEGLPKVLDGVKRGAYKDVQGHEGPGQRRPRR